MGYPDPPIPRFFRGDPEDRSLDYFEKQFVIPLCVRNLAKVEKCTAENEALETCLKSSLFKYFSCVPENRALRRCVKSRRKDEHLWMKCTENYIEKRTFQRMMYHEP